MAGQSFECVVITYGVEKARGCISRSVHYVWEVNKLGRSVCMVTVQRAGGEAWHKSTEHCPTVVRGKRQQAPPPQGTQDRQASLTVSAWGANLSRHVGVDKEVPP